MSSAQSGGGVFFGLFGGGTTSANATATTATSFDAVSLESTAEAFSQSVQQASQLTHAERSLVISTFEDRESQDISVRTLQNPNECRAVTYFVRQAVYDPELAQCCSCEPERAASIASRLKKEAAEAQKASLEQSCSRSRSRDGACCRSRGAGRSSVASAAALREPGAPRRSKNAAGPEFGARCVGNDMILGK